MQMMFCIFLILPFNTSMASLNAIPTVIVVPQPIQLNAKSWVLMDFETGEIISEFNMNEQRAPASLTKIMTAYVIASEIQQDALKLDQKIIISKHASQKGGSKMFIRDGEQITVENLLRGMMIQSGNDASVALAEFVAGSSENFAFIMNKVAKALGLKNTNFVNPDGLPAENEHSSAFDMAVLTRAFIYNYPAIYKLYSETSFSYNNITQPNRNRLLKNYEGTDGVKTGYTNKAAYNIVVSAKRDQQRLIGVVMGAPSASIREAEAQKLLNFGFSKYTNYTVAISGDTMEIDAKNIINAKNNQVLKLQTQETITKTIPKSFVPHINKKIILLPGLKAPIQKNQKVGSLHVTAGDHVITDIALYASNDLAEKNFFNRLFS